jgi:hypothetical protein
LGQLRQIGQRLVHVAQQGFAGCRVTSSPNFVLSHPSAQVLLGSRQLHKALVNVAGDASAYHLAFGFTQGKNGPHTLQYDAGCQE